MRAQRIDGRSARLRERAAEVNEEEVKKRLAQQAELMKKQCKVMKELLANGGVAANAGKAAALEAEPIDAFERRAHAARWWLGCGQRRSRAGRARTALRDFRRSCCRRRCTWIRRARACLCRSTAYIRPFT